MAARFVIVSGLPGSGKTTLGRRLSAALSLPFIDKDDILEQLLDVYGVGNGDWRRKLSRESDVIFQEYAKASAGAVLVSFWHLEGMPLDSGTPTAWLRELWKPIVNVDCVCAPEVAAARFLGRKRHRGHLDTESETELLSDLRALEELGPIGIQPRVEVDTSREVQLDRVIRDIHAAIGSSAGE